jgi:acyl-CoA synthetase (AMP-forming)/AMP-acid ligase II
MIHTSPWPAPAIPGVTLTGHLLAAAARTPDQVALIDGTTGTATTYQALVDAIGAAAARLIAAGVRPGDVVGLVAPNCPAWPVALHGALAAGAAVAPLNPMCTAAELTSQLQATGAVAVVAHAMAGERVEEAARAAGLAGMLALDDVTAAGPSAPELPPPADPGDVAVLPFSSGTTGLPKVVQLTHRNLVANIEQHRDLQRLRPGDVLCAVVPFFHSYGLTLVLHTALAHGASVVTLPRFELGAYLSVIERYQVTRLHVAPPVLRALADAPANAGHDLSSVQVAVCGAAPLDPALAAAVTKRYGFPVIQGYGMTEAAPGTHFTPDDRWGSVPEGSVGWLIPGTEARIEPVAADAGAAPGSGEAGHGELWVRGPQVMRGYLGAAEATAATLDEDGWLRSGDVVRVDGDGCFYVVDRVKELIKYKGYQVAPAELEAVVMGHPAVRDAAVVGIADPVAGELPKAYVVAGDDLDETELLDWVAERVAPYKKIRLVERVGEIPRSPAGKVLRRVLRDS